MPTRAQIDAAHGTPLHEQQAVEDSEVLAVGDDGELVRIVVGYVRETHGDVRVRETTSGRLAVSRTGRLLFATTQRESPESLAFVAEPAR